MLYSWKADGNLFFEFHGDPDIKPTGRYYESCVLDDKEGKTEATEIVAPYWEK